MWVHLGCILVSLLCSNHVTRRWGKGVMPRRYWLSREDVRGEARRVLGRVGEDVRGVRVGLGPSVRDDHDGEGKWTRRRGRRRGLRDRVGSSLDGEHFDSEDGERQRVGPDGELGCGELGGSEGGGGGAVMRPRHVKKPSRSVFREDRQDTGGGRYTSMGL
jgi:hypothetical protein